MNFSSNGPEQLALLAELDALCGHDRPSEEPSEAVSEATYAELEAHLDPPKIPGYLNGPRSIIYFFTDRLDGWEGDARLAISGQRVHHLLAGYAEKHDPEHAEVLRRRGDTVLADLIITVKFYSETDEAEQRGLRSVNLEDKYANVYYCDDLVLMPYTQVLRGPGAMIPTGILLYLIAEDREAEAPALASAIRRYADNHFCSDGEIEVRQPGCEPYWLYEVNLAHHDLAELEQEHGPLTPIPGSIMASNFVGDYGYSPNEGTYPGRAYLIPAVPYVEAEGDGDCDREYWEEEFGVSCVIFMPDRTFIAKVSGIDPSVTWSKKREQMGRHPFVTPRPVANNSRPYRPEDS
jgi:hypothetical protein